MPGKSVPISVRMAAEDSVFLARLNIPDAHTPSEKLRALVAEARERRELVRDYSGCLALSESWVAPVKALVRKTERTERQHSELVSQTVDWLAECFAYVLAQQAELTVDDGTARLSEFEAGLAERVFRLLDNTLRLGVTAHCQAYDTAVVANNIGPVLELAQLIAGDDHTRKGST